MGGITVTLTPLGERRTRPRSERERQLESKKVKRLWRSGIEVNLQYNNTPYSASSSSLLLLPAIDESFRGLAWTRFRELKTLVWLGFSTVREIFGRRLSTTWQCPNRIFEPFTKKCVRQPKLKSLFSLSKFEPSKPKWTVKMRCSGSAPQKFFRGAVKRFHHWFKFRATLSISYR